MNRSCKGIVIAATQSGSGKTTVSLGLIAAFVRRGLTVAPFKVGPDFIDPGHHKTITGRDSLNLDGWILSRDYNRSCFNRGVIRSDVAVVEGVMGLFDGCSGRSEAGSTAQMAKWLGLPVLLVVDASSMARSAAAIVRGFEQFDPALSFAGVIFNNLGSHDHFQFVSEALAENVKMPCLGGIMRNEALRMPERHLGLVTSEDNPLSREMVDRLADTIETSIRVDQLIASLPDIQIRSDETDKKTATGFTPTVRIGVARDQAFCFYYPDNFDLLKSSGAELVFFSPLVETALPSDLDGLYFGGGYPELYAEKLSDNASLRNQIRMASRAGMPIYGECGGFMYLGRDITDLNDRTYPMTGCLPFNTRITPHLQRLGYREITLHKDCILGTAGRTIRGHEFHYSELINGPETEKTETVYRVSARTGQPESDEGYQHRRTLGSYIHCHFGSNPCAARAFTDACRIYRNE